MYKSISAKSHNELINKINDHLPEWFPVGNISVHTEKRHIEEIATVAGSCRVIIQDEILTYNHTYSQTLEKVHTSD